MAIGGTGCDVLIQSSDDQTCRGFRHIALFRPVRILVHAGSSSSSSAASGLVDALANEFASLGVELSSSEMPCHGSLHQTCMADGERQTLNLLAWVGSAEAPSPEEELVTARWLDAAGNRAALAVVPEGLDPDAVVPARLRDRQVVWWGGHAGATALDVMAAADVATAERRIFVSYSHADGVELAHAVFHSLSEARFSVFLDAFALTPGVDFAERIEHEMLDKAFLVLIETPAAIASEWVMHEVAFARQHRLGLAAVLADDSGPRLAGFGRARRWTPPRGALRAPGPARPAFAPAAAADLREFVIRLHGEAITRRRQALHGGMYAALRRAGISRGDVRGSYSTLRIKAGGKRWAVSLRPRPATLIDMHSAAVSAPADAHAVMVSATPRGSREREALGWLVRKSDVHHRDEGHLLSLARGIASGTVPP